MTLAASAEATGLSLLCSFRRSLFLIWPLVKAVGNNLAHLTTTGYKDNRVAFKDLVAQSLSLQNGNCTVTAIHV